MNLEAFYKLTYGLYIVSSNDGEHESGYISNTVMQVTAEPSRIVISSSVDNFTTDLIKKSGVFAVSALGKNTNRTVLGNFGYKSGRDIKKFENLQLLRGKKNVPIVIENCLAWFECQVIQEIHYGTHILFIADVLNCEKLGDDSDTLTYSYYREVLKGKSPKSAPSYINPQKKEIVMKDLSIYVCDVCGYEYDPAKGDPDSGIAPGTAFEDIPDDWLCPLCGVDKTNFSKL